MTAAAERRVSRRNKVIIFLLLLVVGAAVWAAVERKRAEIESARWKASDAEMLAAEDVIVSKDTTIRNMESALDRVAEANEAFSAEVDRLTELSEIRWRTILDLRAGAAVATGDPVAVPPPSTHDPADPCPEPTPCIVPSGAVLDLVVDLAEGVTPAGNAVWIGTGTVRRLSPPPESVIYQQPFETARNEPPEGEGGPVAPAPGSEVLSVPEKAERTWGRWGVLVGGSLLSPESVFIPSAEQTFSFGDDVAVNLGGAFRWKSGQVEAFASTNKSITLNYVHFWGKD